MNTVLKFSLLSSLALLSLAAAASAQAFNWTLETPPVAPSLRERCVSGTDGTLYYLYGGQISNGSVTGLDELWAYDGTSWSLLTASGASAGTRRGGVGAFDIARGKFVVFSGNNTAGGTGHDNDTWEWDATNGWVQVTPATSPDARWLVGNGCYVPGLGVVFHGGLAWDAAGNTYRSGETWAFTGFDWVMLSNTGPIGQNMMMVYRDAHNDLILNGGQRYDASGASLGIPGETWRFDVGTLTWSQVATATTPVNSSNPSQGLFAAMMYYNPLTDRVIVHGGNGGSGNNTTWEFDGVDWTDISTNGAPCRNGGMHWIAALGKGVYGPCNEFNGTRNRTRSHGPQAWGSFDLSGTDCPVISSGLTAGLATTAAMPAISQPLDVVLTDLTATNLPIIGLGTAVQAAPIPMSLLFPGSGAACSVQVDAILIAVGPSWTWAVPNDPNLVGQTIFAQGFQLDPGLTVANTQLGAITLGEF